MRSTNPSNFLHPACWLFVSGALGVLLVSCSSTHGPVAAAPNQTLARDPAIDGRWAKVRSNPPTWYPRGVPDDFPTDHSSGVWVFTYDAVGTCFFIPLHGIAKDRRQALVAEALAARDMSGIATRDRQQAAADFPDTAKAATACLFKLPFRALAAVTGLFEGPIGGMGAPSICPSSIGNISCAQGAGGCGVGH